MLPELRWQYINGANCCVDTIGRVAGRKAIPSGPYSVSCFLRCAKEVERLYSDPFKLIARDLDIYNFGIAHTRHDFLSVHQAMPAKSCYTDNMAAFVIRSITKQDVIQFLEYLVGGMVYFWSGYLVFAFCYTGLGMDWFPAKIAADLVGWTLNYLVQRYWAFNSPRLKTHEERTIGRYSLLTLGNLVLDYLIIASLKAVGITPYVGFFISAGFFTIWNYVWYRLWVFYRKQTIKGGEI